MNVWSIKKLVELYNETKQMYLSYFSLPRLFAKQSLIDKDWYPITLPCPDILRDSVYIAIICSQLLFKLLLHIFMLNMAFYLFFLSFVRWTLQTKPVVPGHTWERTFFPDMVLVRLVLCVTGLFLWGSERESLQTDEDKIDQDLQYY